MHEQALASMIDAWFEWVFESAVEYQVSLEDALVQAADVVLQRLQEEIGEETKVPWPPSRVVPWPKSQTAGVDTNRHPWAVAGEGAIYLGYGEGETAALALEPITYEELGQGPPPAEPKELR